MFNRRINNSWQQKIMTEETSIASVYRVTEKERVKQDDVVVAEFPLTIIFNNEELATMLCSPSKLKYLAIGFLASEGLIKNKDDIEKVLLNEERGSVRVNTAKDPVMGSDMVFKRFITSGCGKGTMLYSFADAMNQEAVDSEMAIPSSRIFELMKEFQDRSQIFKNTGGVHSAALADSEGIIIFAEDIGRHNAVDKVFGECLWEGISTQDKILLTSGRVSSEILFKIAKRNVPIMVSRSAPTDLAIRAANDLGITLIGFVRGKRMNIYTNDQRVLK
jgi:FdhD protein